MLIKQTIVAQRRQLEALAEVWLSSGASSYAVADVEDCVLLYWPKSAEINPKPDIRTPIKRRRKVIGYLHLGGIRDDLSERRLAAEAQLIAQLVALNHDIDQLTQEVVDRQDELVAMVELTQKTRNKLDIRQLTETVLQQATHLLGCDCAFVAADMPEAFSQPVYQCLGKHIPHEILQSWLLNVQVNDQELIINRSSAEMLLPQGIDNVLVAPLMIRGSIEALIGLANKRDGDFTYPNRKLLSAVAQQVAAQFENALLHAEILKQTKRKAEYELAHDVQMHLLPTEAPKLPFLQIAAQSRPAREVGGDFYDYLPSEEGELYFSVGDVSGKGMPAAMLMGMSHATLSSAARFLEEPTPAAILDRANTALYDNFTEVSMFATVFVGQYDSAFRTLSYANAGHSPVIYCPANGKAIMLEADGTALGILPWCMSEDHNIALDEGDILVVASDGFPEARDPNGEMFGYERLMRMIEDNRTESAENLLTILADAIKKHSGDTEQDDDETIMVLKGDV
ncbi:MAG: PP2C family protein-serine/threonine phosphatase [Candidatus Promineifilaceae bacterium]